MARADWTRVQNISEDAFFAGYNKSKQVPVKTASQSNPTPPSGPLQQVSAQNVSAAVFFAAYKEPNQGSVKSNSSEDYFAAYKAPAKSSVPAIPVNDEKPKVKTVQNISEADFWAHYKPPTQRFAPVRGKSPVNSQSSLKVSPISPPLVTPSLPIKQNVMPATAASVFTVPASSAEQDVVSDCSLEGFRSTSQIASATTATVSNMPAKQEIVSDCSREGSRSTSQVAPVTVAPVIALPAALTQQIITPVANVFVPSMPPTFTKPAADSQGRDRPASQSSSKMSPTAQVFTPAGFNNHNQSMPFAATAATAPIATIPEGSTRHTPYITATVSSMSAVLNKHLATVLASAMPVADKEHTVVDNAREGIHTTSQAAPMSTATKETSTGMPSWISSPAGLAGSIWAPKASIATSVPNMPTNSHKRVSFREVFERSQTPLKSALTGAATVFTVPTSLTKNTTHTDKAPTFVAPVASSSKPYSVPEPVATSARLPKQHTSDHGSAQEGSKASSKMSATAPIFTMTSSLAEQNVATRSSDKVISSSEMSATAALFVMPARPPPQVFRSNSWSSDASSKLSAQALEFIPSSPPTTPYHNITSIITDKTVDTLPAAIKKPTPVSRVVLVGGKNGPWVNFGPDYTDDSLIDLDGAVGEGVLELDDAVSDSGMTAQPREVVRANEGEDATNQLLGWDEQWVPPPADWENDRPDFKGQFVPRYIMEWILTVPCGKDVTVNINNQCFKTGTSSADNDVLIAEVYQPITTRNPNINYNAVPTLPSTSEASITKATAKAKEARANKKSWADAHTARHAEIEAMVPGPQPYTPKFDMYLRPAEPKDAAGIAYIYNYDALNDHHIEDQVEITVDQVKWLITNAKQNKLPFIVAINGLCPKVHSMHNAEKVIGFSRIDPFSYGMTGSIGTGASRATGLLHAHVHHQFRRKLVGYNLIDRLLHNISPAHAYMGGATWANPEQAKYVESGGCGMWHQVFFKMAVHKKDDSEFAWKKQFLYSKWIFMEGGRLKSAARSSKVAHGGKFMDVVFLQRETAHYAEFDCFQ